jgi:hypothetical protein
MQSLEQCLSEDAAPEPQEGAAASSQKHELSTQLAAAADKQEEHAAHSRSGAGGAVLQQQEHTGCTLDLVIAVGMLVGLAVVLVCGLVMLASSAPISMW